MTEDPGGNGTWDGENRRDGKRRYLLDRRIVERKRRYMYGILLPVIVGILGTGVIGWGAYVTHTTYSISANYEQSFKKYISDNNGHIIDVNRRLDDSQEDYNKKILDLRHDLNTSFQEMRKAQENIYTLLIRHSKDDK